ncbi:MAG: response regulator transcription factor [Actinomycetota bacterium]|nr:response regulator transcription factor [Actinomycetota bacterium]MDQ6949538.1 response regulator transcription factor [Actinomycetota bacterium]
MIRVVIADDHDVVRRGLAQLFAGIADIDVVGEATNGAHAAELAAAHQPHVVLMDLSMPGVDGVEGTRRIKAAQPDLPVVILTSFSERERILEAIDAGAVGYLLKDAEPDELLRGIRSAAQGESPFSPKAAKALLALGAQRKAAEDLTPRERQVLGALCTGLANKQIARQLGISEKTVKSHLTNVFTRIGVQDRTQAALWAQRHGLGNPD